MAKKRSQPASRSSAGMTSSKGRATPGKRQRRLGRRRQRQRQRYLWIGLIALVAVALGAYVFLPYETPAPLSPARLQEDPALGPVDAPVTITEFGDFGCTACRAWHQAGVLDQIRASYGDQVRIVWRDLPIITPQSPKAAEAAQCAYDQGFFWEYHDLLFDRAPRLGVPDLKAYAMEAGLDPGQFNTCLDSGQHRDTVERDLREAYRMGFQGTPSFLVNDQPLVGPTPERMVQVIESLLSSP